MQLIGRLSDIDTKAQIRSVIVVQYCTVGWVDFAEAALIGF